VVQVVVVVQEREAQKVLELTLVLTLEAAVVVDQLTLVVLQIHAVVTVVQVSL
jgi:hypothetical protein